jgi:DHA1 family bicyclomycin/chloramphenicol resistance-like MFS transporter
MAVQTGRLFAVCLASIGLISPLAIHLFLPVIPVLKQSFGVSNAQAQMSFSLALLVMAISTLVYGSLSDRYGRRPVLLSGLALFLLGGLIGVLAESMTMLIVGRLVQAVGAGCGTTLVRAIARDAYGPDKLIQVISYLTMFYTVGPMFAPMIGGFLVDAFDWRAVFVFSLSAGVVVALGAYFFVPETRPGAKPAPGQGIWRGYADLFANPRFTGYSLQPGFSTGAFFANATAASFIMKEYLQRPASEFGLYFFLFPAGFFCGNFVSSRIGNRVATETMVLAGSIILFVAVLVQASLLVSGHVSPQTIFFPAFFIPFAQGISLPYAQSGAMAIIPRLAGTASGVGIFAQSFGGAVFAQLYGMLADNTLWPMALVTGSSALLCLLFGALPYALRMRENAARRNF